MAPMGTGLQAWKIRAALEKRGIDPEAVDVEAHLDDSLTFSENLDNLTEVLGLRLSSKSEEETWRRWEQEEKARLACGGEDPFNAEAPAVALRPSPRIRETARDVVVPVVAKIVHMVQVERVPRAPEYVPFVGQETPREEWPITTHHPNRPRRSRMVPFNDTLRALRSIGRDARSAQFGRRRLGVAC